MGYNGLLYVTMGYYMLLWVTMGYYGQCGIIKYIRTHKNP